MRSYDVRTPEGREAGLKLVRALPVLALLALASPVTAQAPAEPTVGVTVRGIAGPIIKARPRRFVAVNVVLENTTAIDQDGALRVYRAEGPSKPAAQQRLFYERRVSLPRGAKRVETVYYYCQEDEPQSQLCVAFAPDEGTAPPPTFPKVEVIDDRLLALVLSSSQDVDEAKRLFALAQVPGGRTPHRVDALGADPTALPDHVAGYDPLDAVVVSDLDPADLPPERAKPLVEWVAAGGDLIVAHSSRGTLVPEPLRPLLPIVRPGGAPRTVELKLQGLRALGRGSNWSVLREDSVLVDDVRAGAGAEVLAAEPLPGGGEVPLVTRGRYGAGWVTYLSFPLDAAPLRRWAGSPMVGGALVRPVREPFVGQRVAAAAPPLEELVWNLSEAIASLTPPSALVIGPLLILYVALVGPIAFFALSKKGRPGLAQPVGAAVVLAFGAMFYLVGRLSKSSEDLVTQVAVVELPVAAPNGSEPATASRIDVMTGHYSTGQGLVSAAGPADAVIGPIAEQVTRREGRVLQEPKGAKLEAVTVPTYAMRRFRSLRVAPVGRLEAELKLEGNGATGRLVNSTNMTLETPLLVFQNGLQVLAKELQPNQGVNLSGVSARTWDQLDETQGVDGVPLLAGLIADVGKGGYAATYGKAIAMTGISTDPYRGSDARRIMAILRHRLERVPSSVDRVPALLVARAQGDPGGVVVEGTGQPRVARSIVVAELQVAVGPGPLRLAGVPPRVRGWGEEKDWTPIGGATGAAPILGVSTMDAEVTFLFQVPCNEATKLDPRGGFRLRWRIDPDLMQMPKALYLDAFNFSRGEGGQWVVLADAGTAERTEAGDRHWQTDPGEFPDLRPEDFVHPQSGTVWVRLRHTPLAPTNGVSILKLVLDVAGDRQD